MLLSAPAMLLSAPAIKDARIWNGLELDQSTGLIIQSSPGRLDCSVLDIHIPHPHPQRILDWTGLRNA